jgi:hypothetical protein
MKKTSRVPTDAEIRGQLDQYLDITNAVDVPPRIREITAERLNDRPRLSRTLVGGGAVLALAAATAVLVLAAHQPHPTATLPGVTGSAVSASPIASPTLVPATPSASIPATPSASAPAPSPSLPLSTYDPQQPDQVALELYAGGGTALSGYVDCLTTTSGCLVTPRLMARFSAFSDSNQAHNAGAGSTDPLCRGCQDGLVSVVVTSAVTSATGATVYVAIDDGGGPWPLAILEMAQGGDYLVDDVQCVKGGAPDPQTSLYLVSIPSCPVADSG